MFTAGLPFTRLGRLLTLLLPLAAGTTLHAGTASAAKADGKNPPQGVQQVLDEVTPLTELSYETSYVGSSGFQQKQFDGSDPLSANGGTQRPYGHIDELQTSVAATHRFHLFDKVYLKLGASYERFDFGVTDAPLPATLQSLNAVVALEYVVRGNTAAFITTSPGVYFSQTGGIGLGNVDASTAIGTAFKVPWLPRVYGLVGARFSALAKYPVYPIAGIVWVIRDDLKLKLVPPDPRLVYNFSDRLDFVVGAELLGETYKRDFNDHYRLQFKRFGGSLIDYSETRVGGGVTYKPARGVEIDLRGGWDLGRTFNYYRGDSKRFTTHGAPYAKLAVNAEF